MPLDGLIHNFQVNIPPILHLLVSLHHIAVHASYIWISKL